MESLGLFTSILAFLSPVAFVFALSALSYIGKLKKDIEQIKEDLKEVKKI